METYKRAVAAILATASLLFSTALPAFAADTLEISGNGAYSENKVDLNSTRNVTVVQENDAKISNEVKAESNTGENTASKNTGGDVKVETGDAISSVDISNAANLNKAKVEDCNACSGDVDVLISGNGADSENKVDLDKNNNVQIFQDNKARINNDVYAKAETGENQADKNTGGHTSIKTGDALTDVQISNAVNANVAAVKSAKDQGGKVSAKILGNGAQSENKIYLDLDQSATIVQENKAWIDNDVYAKAETGENQADKNTGGDVTIRTGDAAALVGIDNLANFNAAELDCCVFDVSAKISGNGADSENKIKANLNNIQDIFQDKNKAWLDNHVYAKAETGENEADKNTGPVDDAVLVATGDALDSVEINNAANANIFTSGGDLEIPSDFDLDIHFDLGSLFGFLSA